MKPIKTMTPEERKAGFELFLKRHVNSAQKYISALEKGFSESPISQYGSIYEIIDPEILEDLNLTKALRNSSTFTRMTSGGTQGLAGLNWYIRFLRDSRDSYYDFMQHFGIKSKDFFEWGMNSIIFPPEEMVEAEWDDLKKRIFNNKQVYIRGYRRDAVGTYLYIDFYKYLLGNENVKKDPTNNTRPQAIMKRLTGLTRNTDLYNYQVSHIWGQTKNVFLFESPWNICYVPKLIDPLTGHEAKGDLPIDFQIHFVEHAKKKYKKYIDDYNKIISQYDIKTVLNKYCIKQSIQDARFENSVLMELSQI